MHDIETSLVSVVVLALGLPLIAFADKPQPPTPNGIIGNHSEGWIKVIDLSGRMTYSGLVVDSTCQLPELTEGIYLVSYANDGNTTTTK